MSKERQPEEFVVVDDETKEQRKDNPANFSTIVHNPAK